MREKKNNILLIGFMGVGKGTIARELSAYLGKFCLDTDDLIESSQNRKISEIFHKDGEIFFRKCEKNLAKFLKNSVNDAVISTGGGFYMVKKLKKIGKVVYLKSSFDYIYQRLKNSENFDNEISKRPLFLNLESARDLYNIREKEYKKVADLVIEVNDKSPKQITKEIIKKIVERI